MNDTFVTVIGNVVADPRHVVTASGTHIANLRLASTSRKFDRDLGKWRDGDTLYIGVSCWRSLADNVAASVVKGEPLIVTGRLRMHSYTAQDGQRRTSVDIDASAVGHDLSRGVTHFRKADRFSGQERWIHPTPATAPPQTPESYDRGADRVEELSSDDGYERNATTDAGGLIAPHSAASFPTASQTEAA